MNKVRLHFTWEHGIEAESSLYTIDVDKLRQDESLSPTGESIKQRLLDYIDDEADFVESSLQNDIYGAEDKDEFDLSKYHIKDDVRTLTIQSWQAP